VTSRGEYRGLGKLGGSSLELALKYHVSAVRYGKHHQILAVRHVNFGWMAIRDYYLLQKIHDVLPLIQTGVTAGYQLKAWIWGAQVDFEVAGTGVKVPFGAILITLIGVECALLAAQNVELAGLNAQLQSQISALQGQIAAIQAQVGPTGSGKHHHQKSGGQNTAGGSLAVVLSQAEADILIAPLQQKVLELQAQLGPHQQQISQNQLSMFLLIAASVLPFGELYLMWHYATAILGGLGSLGSDVGAFWGWLTSQPAFEIVAPIPTGLTWLAEHNGWGDITSALDKLVPG
jgi:hypothetical protein